MIVTVVVTNVNSIAWKTTVDRRLLWPVKDQAACALTSVALSVILVAASALLIGHVCLTSSAIAANFS